MTQLPLGPKPHNNHYLFSDYYLDNRARERREWIEADVRAGFETLAGLWQQRKSALINANEPQTEEDWIKPVLKALGHHFAVQVSIQVQGGSKTPDYILCPDEATRAGIQNKAGVLNEADVAGALAVADAKAWERPLDRTLPQAGVRTLHEHPGLQIDTYIRHAGLAWGLLTNGRLWRLYHKDSSKKLDVFYEVDLPALLEADDLEGFKYFWLFFRREAFAGAAQQAEAGLPSGHPAWLELVRAESESYERGVSEGLKKQVYDALQALAQGFLDFPANGLTSDPATLKAVYDNSLIVLYRLLFILYAEARDLLPVATNETYRETYSLQALRRRVAQDIDRKRPAAPSMAGLWDEMRNLWRVIDSGDDFLGVPAYNGGLFKPTNHPFLEQYRVGDSHLRTAIDLLARIRDARTGKAEFVDYRDLEVRHLGSIYEGLLEYHVQAEGDGTSGGEVSLLNDKGERKATGSYYTPDYIVQYIVEHTVGPVLAEVAAPYLDAEGGASDPAGLERAVLAINVLDPAMGSGHFLVAAADFIARFLVERNLAGEDPDSPSEIRDSQSDLAYWRRRVAQACIYGVDLNPLAVELAKLSLWLATVSKDKPLSFLDHHLRCGNSLIGARVADLPLQGPPPKKQTAQQKRKEREAAAAGQLSMLDDSAFAGSMMTATGMMGLIESLGSETLADVRQAESVYRDSVRDVTKKARLLADLWTARHFGLDIPDELWAGLAKFVLHGGFAMPGWDELIARGQAIAGERRFFHWELEFPEVFFDEHGRLQGESAGFEAVIGNPPYVRQEELSPLKPYLALAYPQVYYGTADLFVYFFSQALRSLRQGGLTSYISSNSWLRANYAMSLRRFLRGEMTVESLIDLGDNRVFVDAPDVYPVVHVVRKQQGSGDQTAQAAVFSRGEGVSDFSQQLEPKLFSLSIHDQPDEGWQLENDVFRRVFSKLMATGQTLGSTIGGRMYRGVVTGLNDAFIIDKSTRDSLIRTDPNSASIIKPFISGANVRRGYVERSDEWLIFMRRGTNIEDYPAIKQHLEQYRHRLEPRPSDLGRYANWPGRKPGPYEWYEIQDVTAYFEEFDKVKIMWPEMAREPRFALVEPGVFGNKTTFLIPEEQPYLIGILMSRVTWFVVMRLCVPIGERMGRLRYTLSSQFMSQLPIPTADTGKTQHVGNSALNIIAHASGRYDLHENTRHRIQFDLGAPGKNLNQKLTAWWELDYSAFRAEVKKVFKRDIPLKQRDEWESWLAEQRAEHERLTADIVRLETELNSQVYELFGLMPTEISIIEEATKYQYGEI